MDPQPHAEQNALPFVDDTDQDAPTQGPSDGADTWVADLQDLRRQYETAEVRPEAPTRDVGDRTAAQNLRVYAMSPEELEAVERMSFEEQIAWMCEVDMEEHGVPIDHHLGLVPTSEQPPLDFGLGPKADGSNSCLPSGEGG